MYIAQELLSRVERFVEFKSRHKNWTTSLERIRSFSDVLQPYFDIFNILQSSHPELAAIAWGSFLLVLRLACNFSSFFDKLAEILERLSLLMPNYARLAGLIEGRVSERFYLSLRNLYLDLFDFFQAVARVFTQKDGSLKRTPVVISQLMWRPFDRRFENFSKRLAFHSEMLKNELSLFQVEAQIFTAEELKGHTKESRDFRVEVKEYFELVRHLGSESSAETPKKVCDRIKRWLNPPPFMEERETSQSLRESGTALWLRTNREFLRWQADSKTPLEASPYENFLWIKGNPGCGKTVLAASTVQYLESQTQPFDNHRRVICFYFFSYTTIQKRATSNAYRSILTQALHQCRHDTAVIDAFSFVQSTATSGQTTASYEDLIRLLIMVPQRLQSMHVILDGVDESDPVDALVPQLASAFQDLNVRVLFFSRPNVDSLRKATSLRSVMVTRKLVEQDLKIFLSRQLDSLIDQGLLQAAEPRGQLVEHLLAGADGMFVWARLMMSYLSSPALVPTTRLASIKTLNSPDQIEELYIRILGLLATRVKPEQQLARNVFLWLSYQHYTLDAAALQDAVTPLKRNVQTSAPPHEKRTRADEFGDFEHTVVMACGSLVELRNGYYRFIHHSAHEFFRTWATTELDKFSTRETQTYQRFLATSLEAENELAATCLSYLLYRAPAQPLSGDMREAAQGSMVRKTFPFLRYASINWMQHLKNSSTEQTEGSFPLEHQPPLVQFQSVLKYLTHFLTNQLVVMSWIESFYTFQDPEQHEVAHSAMKAWAGWAQEIEIEKFPRKYSRTPNILISFSSELSEINELWGSTLRSAPHKIWTDVAGFTSSRFLLKNSAFSVNSMATVTSGNIELSSKPLSTTSVDAHGGDRIGVLSIWPSKSFEIMWAKLGLEKFSFGSDSEFAGWVARFEIWKTDSEEPERVSDQQIPLDRNDVANQVASFVGKSRHNSRQGHRGDRDEFKWVLPFPTTISSDLSILIILKRAYFLDPSLVGPRVSKITNATLIRSVFIQEETSDHSVLPDSPVETHDDSQLEYSPNGNCVSFSYKFQIHQNNRFILYEDALRVDLPHGFKLKPSINSLTVFDLNVLPSTESCTYIGTFGGTDERSCLSTCSFHPHLPLVLLFSKSFRTSSSIILWSFASRRKTSKVLCDTDSVVETLDFSACGTQVVVKLFDHLPEVLSLEADALYQSVLQAYQSQSDSISITRENNQLKLLRPEDSRQLAKATEPISQKVHLSSTGSHQEVQVSYHFHNSQVVQPVLSLPNWTGIRDISVGVHAPRTREEKIRIILNKTMQPWYSLSDPLDVHLPAIVQKDARLLESSCKREREMSTLQRLEEPEPRKRLSR